jgi:hypothetical protein
LELHVTIRGQRAVEGYVAFRSWACTQLGVSDDDSELFTRVRVRMLKDRQMELPDILTVMEDNARLKDAVDKLNELNVNLKDRIQSLENTWAMNQRDPIKKDTLLS